MPARKRGGLRCPKHTFYGNCDIVAVLPKPSDRTHAAEFGAARALVAETDTKQGIGFGKLIGFSAASDPFFLFSGRRPWNFRIEP
jgi:hypothetical protein